MKMTTELKTHNKTRIAIVSDIRSEIEQFWEILQHSLEIIE